MTTYAHRRNPVIRHGELDSNFVQIPNELARDPALSHHAYRIAIVLRTHKDGFEVSAKSMADTYAWGRTRTAQAFKELVDTGWLAVRRHVNASGYRVFDQYHVHVSRRFTPDEVAEHAKTVVLPTRTGDASREVIHLDSLEAAGCSETDQEGDSTGITKEHHLEHHLEHHSEDQCLEHTAVANRREPGTPEPRCIACEQYGQRECQQHAEAYATTSFSGLIPDFVMSQHDEPNW
ncbi:hypothetical protein VIMS_03592 [Mycobacterium marinum]|uniref:hypothetical protein n=1 Tax=Mycobacterium marinum TaxID=1781 RepID=UPI000EDABD58|nr:hypothetical protein [Mycobacterium marinum]RFZ10236.1 hypothetical protein VIMS_03592 [Mycobacterium marinum]